LNYHPLKNDATTTIRSSDLLRFISYLGHEPIVIDLDPPVSS
jgi:Ala-tRNA(Pro) deacylase